MSNARVYFVGAGPGAADLLTVRAAQLLARADVVLHDALVDQTVLALASQARLIPVGKRAHSPSTEQRFINKALVDYARTMKVVVRLKGGDPSIFGRLDEEMQALRAAGVAFEVVPGITAASAAAAELQASLTLAWRCTLGDVLDAVRLRRARRRNMAAGGSQCARRRVVGGLHGGPTNRYDCAAADRQRMRSYHADCSA